MDTQKYARKPFVVDAVEVTAENLEEVAKWCGGEVRTKKQTGEFTELEYDVQYIKVKVKRALNQRQTEAYIGDRVLKAGTGFKVYTAQAFFNSFEKVLGEDEGLEELGSHVTLVVDNAHSMSIEHTVDNLDKYEIAEQTGSGTPKFVEPNND